MRETHVIDCDAAPFIPGGWSIREEDQLPGRVRGNLTWDPVKVKLVLCRGQDEGYIQGTSVRQSASRPRAARPVDSTPKEGKMRRLTVSSEVIATLALVLVATVLAPICLEASMHQIRVTEPSRV